MSTPSPTGRELERLIDAALADDISGEDLARLGDLLRSDEDARLRFLDASALDADIYFNVRLARADGEARNATSVRPASKSKRSKSLLQRASRRPKGPSIAVAATVLIAMIATMAVTPASKWFAGARKDTEEVRQPQGPTDSEYVAILDSSKGAVWLHGKPPSLSDPRLRIGRRLALKSGLIEIKYYTGSRVVIEGPADFTIGPKTAGEAQSDEDKRNSGYLERGKLYAHVEGEDAQGFFVDTPTARVEDLGTEFGVEVDDVGDTLLEVVRGKVEMHKTDDNGETLASIRIAAGSAARVSLGSDRIRTVSTTGRFVAKVPLPDVPVPQLEFSTVSPQKNVKLPAGMIRVDAGGWNNQGHTARLARRVNRFRAEWGIFPRSADGKNEPPFGSRLQRVMAFDPFDDTSNIATVSIEINDLDYSGAKFSFDLVVTGSGPLGSVSKYGRGCAPGESLDAGELVNWKVKNIKTIEAPAGTTVEFAGFTGVGLFQALDPHDAGEVRNAETDEIVGAFDNRVNRNLHKCSKISKKSAATLPLDAKTAKSIDIRSTREGQSFQLRGFLAEFRVVDDPTAPQNDEPDTESTK